MCYAEFIEALFPGTARQGRCEGRIETTVRNGKGIAPKADVVIVPRERRAKQRQS